MTARGWPFRVREVMVRVMLWVAMTALVLMMLVVVADVVLRQALNLPVKGAYDAVSILLCISVFYGIPAVIAGRQEIVIDLIDSMVAPRLVTGLKWIAEFGSAAVLIFVFIAMIGPARDTWRYGDISLELRIPQWWIWVAALGGLAGGILASILALLEPKANEDVKPEGSPE